MCDGEKKLFCKDYVNNAEIMFILASVSSFLVILSLVRFMAVVAFVFVFWLISCHSLLLKGYSMWRYMRQCRFLF